MRKLIFISICMVALLVPIAVLAGGGDFGFDAIVRSIEVKYHAHATRIPFMGMVSFIAGRAGEGGVSRMHVAEFEDFSAPADKDELNNLVEQKLGPGWQRMIRETSRHGAEQSLIFVRPEGKHMGMFVLDVDGSDLDVVQLSVDPDHLNETVAKYQHGQSD